MNTFLRRAAVVCLAFVVVAAIFMAVPVLHIGATSSVLDACVNGGNGMMRLVTSSADCHNNETFVEWNITGPAGPQGPQGTQGPQGPAGTSAGGPPFVWVCTPANWDLANNGDHDAEIDIFNGSGNTANIAANFLASDGTNISGQPIPGTGGAFKYPGQTGNMTVTLASRNTMILTYSTGMGNRAGNSALLASVIVTSDQPVVVGYNVPFGALISAPCALLPR
jgi:hypothetical protein